MYSTRSGKLTPDSGECADRGLGGDVRMLKVGGNRPWRRIVCIDHVEDSLVILKQGGRRCLKKRRRRRCFSGLREIAAGDDGKGILFVEGVGGGAPEPRVSVRVKAVIPRDR